MHTSRGGASTGNRWGGLRRRRWPCSAPAQPWAAVQSLVCATLRRSRLRAADEELAAHRGRAEQAEQGLPAYRSLLQLSPFCHVTVAVALRCWTQRSSAC